MPNNQAHINDFRKGGHKLFAHLSIYKGALVMEGEISAVFPYPMRAVAYTQTSGDWNAIGRGFRYEIFTPGGKFKGRSRVGYGESITSVYLPIRENSKGSIDIQVGDMLRVYADVRLSDKLVEDDEHFNPDGILIGDNNEDPPPWANSGGAVAGSTKQLPFLMTGSTSFVVDPDSGGDLTHLWTLPTGLSFAGGTTSTDADIQITGDPGEYLVIHTVTDDDNGKSVTQYIPVIIHGTGYKPHKVQIESLPNDESTGGSATVKMLGNASFEDVPDGALAILWKEEYIAGVRQSFGAHAPGRSHILYVGIIRREHGSLDADSGVESLTFELISPLARLEELMGYGKVMLNTATPTVWNQIRLLTVLRTILQLFQFYCNLNEAGYDVIVRPSFTNRNIDGAFIQDSTPLGQAREMAKSVQCRIIEDRRGSFFLAKRPDQVALADRATDLETTLSLTMRDTKGWAYDREHWRSVNRVEVRGFAAGYGVVQPIFSEWVGRAPGEGNQTSIEEGAIVSGQTELNEVAGRLGAALNSTYTDADGATQMALDLTIPLRGVYDVFDFYDEVIELTGVTRKRGIDFGDQQYVLVSSSVDFADGTATTTLRLRTCTNGAAGTMFVPSPSAPEDFTDPLTEYPETDYGSALPDPTGVLGRGTANLCVPSTDNTLRYVDLRTGDQESVSLSGDLTGGLLAAILDAYAPTGAVLATTQEADTLTGIFTTQTVGDTYAFSITGFSAAMQSERGTPGLFVVCLYRRANDGGSRSDVYVTTDSGQNWTAYTSLFGTWVGGSGDSFSMGCYVSPAGNIYTSGWSGAGVATGVLKKSTTQGASWSTLGSAFAWGLASDIHISFQDTAESLIFHGGADVVMGSTVYRLYTTTSGGTRTDISPQYGGEKYGPFAPFGVTTCDIDQNSVLCVGQNTDAGGGKRGVFLSRNRGASWATLIVPDTGVTYASGRFAGDDRNTIFLYGDNGALAVSYDGGATWRTYTLGSGRLLNLFGKAG